MRQYVDGYLPYDRRGERVVYIYGMTVADTQRHTPHSLSLSLLPLSISLSLINASTHHYYERVWS